MLVAILISVSPLPAFVISTCIEPKPLYPSVAECPFVPAPTPATLKPQPPELTSNLEPLSAVISVGISIIVPALIVPTLVEGRYEGAFKLMSVSHIPVDVSVQLLVSNRSCPPCTSGKSP